MGSQKMKIIVVFLLFLGLTLSIDLPVDNCEIWDEEAHQIRCCNYETEVCCAYTTNECVGVWSNGERVSEKFNIAKIKWDLPLDCEVWDEDLIKSDVSMIMGYH